MKIVRLQITCSPPPKIKLWLKMYENLVKIYSLVIRRKYNLRALHIFGKINFNKSDTQQKEIKHTI